MDAGIYLQEIAEQFAKLSLEAVLICNAAAAIQGAPVTTLDFDFLVRQTPYTLAKLKKFANALDLVIYRQVYPAAKLLRASRDADQLQLDFHARIDGVHSYESLRARASAVNFGERPLLVASLADVIKSKRAAGRPQDLAILVTLEDTLMPKSKPSGKRLNLKQQFEFMHIAMFDSWLALPPERRTNFLRKRIGICSSAL